MPFKRYGELGRVALVNYGKDYGKLVVIVDVVDQNRLVGWTPLVELKQIVKVEGLDVRIVGKIESYQPLSSIKDRNALRSIEMCLHQLLGNKWLAITARLPGRTDNEIKNVCHTHLKKRVKQGQTVVQ
ncbi:hypothetical protein J5N97_005282 [Dioscorea zingiberensis]|uniref:HTH myb-type domain-containing protein n=1 Tax=Dioscorea zingiberensis TaxID=325984 RepID=A0A9D5HSK3_9LILI|nr:hypothetical protein J5N97_005282 [Dioscorea zingiberensis]